MNALRLNLRYVYCDVDRHGNARVYFWRGKGHRKTRIREPVGGPAFHQRYSELLIGDPRPTSTLDRAPKARTFRWLCVQYFDAPEFTRRLKQRTQYVRRRILESMFDEPIFKGAKETFADFSLDRLTAETLEILRDRKSKYPEAANGRVKALRKVFKWGLGKKHIRSNIAKEVAYIATNSTGWHAWTPEELSKFEQTHSVGTKARLAIDLLQYTGASRSDVVALGPKNVRKGIISYARNKTGVSVELPIPEALLETIASDLPDFFGPRLT